MRNQEFHKGVDGLKSLGTPELELCQFLIWYEFSEEKNHYKHVEL